MVSLVFAWPTPKAQSQAATPNPAKVDDLKMALRDLYVGHIFWVRSLVIATRLGVSGSFRVIELKRKFGEDGETSEVTMQRE